MRAVVIAVKDNRAAVALKGGDYQYVANRDYEIGQIIEIVDSEVKAPQIVDSSRKKRSKGVMSIAKGSVAAASAVLVIAGGITAYAMPVSTVKLDSDLSVSMDINAFGRVVGTASFNEDGKQLMRSLSGRIIGKNTSEAFEETLLLMKNNEYINENDTPIACTVTGSFLSDENDKKRLLENMAEAVDTFNENESDVSVRFTTEDNKEEEAVPQEFQQNRDIPGIEESHQNYESQKEQSQIEQKSTQGQPQPQPDEQSIQEPQEPQSGEEQPQPQEPQPGQEQPQPREPQPGQEQPQPREPQPDQEQPQPQELQPGREQPQPQEPQSGQEQPQPQEQQPGQEQPLPQEQQPSQEQPQPQESQSGLEQTQQPGQQQQVPGQDRSENDGHDQYGGVPGDAPKGR